MRAHVAEHSLVRATGANWGPYWGPNPIAALRKRVIIALSDWNVIPATAPALHFAKLIKIARISIDCQHSAQRGVLVLQC